MRGTFLALNLCCIWTIVGANCSLAQSTPSNAEPVDYAKAKQIYDRLQKNEKVSAEDQAYLEHAKAVKQRADNAGGTSGTLNKNEKNDKNTAPANATGEVIDWEKAKGIHERASRGEKLTADDQAYYDKAKTAMQRGQGPNNNGPQKPAGQRVPQAKSFGPSSGLKPLTDMSVDEKYKGEEGGLYGGGKNQPPEKHLQVAFDLAKKIQPLNAEGQPDTNGKIVLISLGMSNTTQEFSEFVRIANADSEKSQKVVIVDCAQGGMEAMMWATGGSGRPNTQTRDPWTVMDERIKSAGVSAKQVQAIWIKLARANPEAQGEYPKHADEMRGHYVTILNKLPERFPNLKIAYNSSRIYAGNATTRLNPEPFAYETAFVVRRLIQDQVKGDATLNHDASRGEVKSPLLLWGPYLWADGDKGRKVDDLFWKVEDLAGDGTHPNLSGQQKVANLLLSFFKSDSTTKSWFVKSEK